MNWVLAIDYGTTNTSAAAKDRRGTRVLDLAGKRQYPSCVLVDKGGRILTGSDAENVAALSIDRFVATPKRRLAERTIVIGGAEVHVVDLIAATLRAVYSEAERSQGSTPAHVVLTHPARWSAGQIALLQQAAASAGMSKVMMLAEPVAAAKAFISNFDVRAGAPFAVFDLGGGTLDVAIVEQVGDNLRQVAAPGGIDPLGGEDFDAALTQQVLGSGRLAGSLAERLRNPTNVAERGQRRDLQRAVRSAKETLSTSESAYVGVPGLDQPIVLTRAEFDDAIREQVAQAADEMVRSLERSRVGREDLDAVFLAGGSCRIPLVAHEVRARLPGVRIETVGDPKTVTAEGAALFADLPADLPPPVAPGQGPVEPRKRRRSRLTAGATTVVFAVGGLVLAGLTVGAGGGGDDDDDRGGETPTVVTTIEPAPDPTAAPDYPDPTDPPPTDHPDPTDAPPTEPPPTDPPPTDPPPTEPPPTSTASVDRLYDRFPLMFNTQCELGEPIPDLEAYVELCEVFDTPTESGVLFFGNIVEYGYDTASYLDALYLEDEVFPFESGPWSDSFGERGAYMDFEWTIDDASPLVCRAWGDYGSDLVGWACASDLYIVESFWTEHA